MWRLLPHIIVITFSLAGISQKIQVSDGVLLSSKYRILTFLQIKNGVDERV